MGNALTLILIVLLPLVPAYVLYRFLVSQADVSGTVHGLAVKLGGPFAAYFVLFLALANISASLPTYEVWTVRGELAGLGEAEVFDENSVRFVVRPPGVQLAPDGSFRLTLFRMPDPSGSLSLPTVIIDRDGYVPIRLPLEGGEKRRLRRELVLTGPLLLKRMPVVATQDDQ